MIPCRAHQDCVSDPRHQQKSELLAVSSSLDFHWFSVCEVERGETEEKEEGEKYADDKRDKTSLVIESLALLRKKDLSDELRELECCESLELLKPSSIIVVGERVLFVDNMFTRSLSCQCFLVLIKA